MSLSLSHRAGAMKALWLGVNAPLVALGCLIFGSKELQSVRINLKPAERRALTPPKTPLRYALQRAIDSEKLLQTHGNPVSKTAYYLGALTSTVATTAGVIGGLLGVNFALYKTLECIFS